MKIEDGIKIWAIGNHIGDLFVQINEGKYYLAMEDQTFGGEIFKEIPKSLYDELIKFENKRKESIENGK